MVVGFMRVERIVGFMRVEFVVVHMVVGVSVLTKSDLEWKKSNPMCIASEKLEYPRSLSYSHRAQPLPLIHRALHKGVSPPFSSCHPRDVMH